LYYNYCIATLISVYLLSTKHIAILSRDKYLTVPVKSLDEEGGQR